MFDENTMFDFPRSDVFETEAQIGTPGFGDGDFDEWATEDVSERLKRLSEGERTALRRRITHTKKKRYILV